MKNNQKVICPCCNEVLIVSLNSNEVVLSNEKISSTSNTEISNILEELNIEFG
ncbi:hypothetical protein IJ22_19260 [Paenibacillus naphthalenovorans]|uniref:Uncharacterized protein n=1 Tax=Paenibacillus naphthalenovorans TaxID=162209 RepID=A0A0U2UGK4_9BACL|nr:hypothetical protein IJ22_19260 [Paenibacillus naphthalenovorans]